MFLCLGVNEVGKSLLLFIRFLNNCILVSNAIITTIFKVIYMRQTFIFAKIQLSMGKNVT